MLTQNFGENENKDHTDEKSGLLGSSADTSITNDTNGEATVHKNTRLAHWHEISTYHTEQVKNIPSSKTSKTDSKTSTKLDESSV